MRRETQNILLVLLGGALLKIGLNGDYLRYVKPAQQPWVLAGGAVMVALGAVAIVRDIRAHHADDGHGHHHLARSAWLLMLPVLAVFLVAPPALGSDSVTRTEARAPAQSQAVFPPLPQGEVVPLSLTDLVTRAGWDSGGSLNGRTVRLTGFVTHSHGSVLLARMIITCCAADAYPLTVRLAGPTGAAYPDDTWLEVTGQVVPGTATRADRYTPDLVVASVRRIAQPRDPYED
ncbi:TIGR03943 family protein [Amycolatopsis acidiphila]|uniref:TIGR03943 family protein n=1 Tax=Amycolatopsis acidiphila TaxID=715473 RepID=A0A558A5X8_9PSEU|nr:TIGR03943 family protein [Amycolatopsis acidiphila]TVT19638.1 TIGR03943 family protein [Amycolatopsis acidiphila]UIJ61844.1 TIGR03943 family protein [Amycolatopsis acidiphila]GHG57614.1 TIGR03943 family protein [Amycolatopsis acidiphila]